MTRSKETPRAILGCGVIALLLSSGAAGMAALTPLVAIAQSSEIYEFDIPAGSLAQALDDLAVTAGLTLSYDNAALAGLQSPGLAGAFASSEAIERLLRDYGLEAQFLTDTSVVVEAPLAVGSDRTIVLNPIIVQGELIDRALQDTQTSVAVITGEELERRGDVDLGEVVERTPGITSTDGNVKSFVIRGIAQNGVGGGGFGRTITTTIDGARISDSIRLAPTEFSTWDLQQIEILRGPQSTQTGRNALAGAVVVRSNDPTYDFEAKAKAGLGNLDGREAAVALNAPIISDTLALRVAVDHDRNDGAIDNPTLGTDDADAERRTTLRLGLRFDPVKDFTSTLKLTRFKAEAGRGFVDRELFPEDRVTFSDFVETRDTLLQSINWRNSYQIGDRLRLESETNFYDSEVDQLEDRDLEPTPGSTNTVFNETRAVDQEIRFVYESDRLRGVIGGFFTDISSEDFISIVSPAFSADATGITDFRNFAVFGEIEYDLLPELTLIAGGRYDRETIGVELVSAVFPTPFSEATFDAFLPKAGLVYRFTDDISLGFTFQQGFRAGGSGIQISTLEPFDIDPEFTDNFELALRSQFWGGQASFNANAFYTRWRDQQVSVGTGVDQITVNAGRSRLFGGELEIAAEPIDGLSLFGSLAYVDTEFVDFVSGGADLAGNEFPNAADLTAALGAEYSFENGFFLAGDASYTAAAFTDVENIRADRTDNRFLVNARAGYEAENWNVAVFATNLFDVDYITSVGGNVVTVGDPLQFGVRAGVRF